MDVGRHPNIELLAYSEVEKVEGRTGDFRVTVRRKARYVDETKCTGCGACAEKCPAVQPDPYNLALGETKAIYRYFAQGLPASYTINAAHCRQLGLGKKCGLCAKACQAGAVDFGQADRVVELGAGAVIAATGYDLFDARLAPQYGYGRIPDVITALELERFLSAGGPTQGHVYRPSDLARERERAELEKRIRKLRKVLELYEEKHGLDTEAFRRGHGAGADEGEEFAQWAARAEELDALTARLERLGDPAAGLSPAKSLVFIQCVGSRDARFNLHC
ncbi:MAG: 4Fe-4S binding protein, partial [Thermodesulfobacteriota bacterium]